MKTWFSICLTSHGHLPHTMLTGAVTAVLVLLTSLQTLTAQSLDCNFDPGDVACGWKSFGARWEKTPSGHFDITGPDSDHTTGNGAYMMLRSQNYQIGEAKGVFSTPIVNSFNGSCLTFWYYMYGFEVDSLTVYKTRPREDQQELFQVLGNQGMKWYKAVIDTGNGSFSLQIAATYKNGRRFGNIAIDDISFSSEVPCVKDVARTDKPLLDCDFEDDFCFWSFPHKDQSLFGAKRVTVSPSDIKSSTFPPGNDGRSLLKLERVNRYEDQDALIAPAIPIGKDGACLSLWYKPVDPYRDLQSFSIKKNGIGSLLSEMLSEGEILLEPVNADKRNWANFEIWNFAQVNMPPGNDYFIYFHLLFIGRSSPHSYIEIDDIKLDEDGPCKPVPQESLVNCDFDNGLCRWFAPMTEEKTEWIRWKGPTPTLFTGPPGDHTTGDGYYLYCKKPEKHGSEFRTPPFQVGSAGACLTFWYHMYGEDVKSLRLVGHGTNGQYRPIWEIQGNQGEQWIQQNISIAGEIEVFLLFKAFKSYFPRDDIALDDISISFDGLCEKDRLIDNTTSESTTESVTTTPQVKKWIPSPVITINGDTKPALVGSRVEIICGDDFDGASYTWLKKDEHEFNAIEGQENRILLFNRISRSQEGTYMCSVSGEGYLTAESKTFKIDVVRPQLLDPTVNVVGMANPVYQDSRIELHCQDPNNDTELAYQWHKFQGNERKSLSDTGPIVVFDEIQLEEAANYSCTVSKEDFLSAESENVEITVVKDPRPAPWLYHNIRESTIQVDIKVEFRCGNDDVERGVYHWKTNSAAFATSSLPNNRYLIIEKSDPSHSGYYSCRISKDGYFTAKSRVVGLKVAAGKPCTSRYSCWGYSHSGKCVDGRCQCGARAIRRGNTCVERPRAPEITISPNYRKFTHGETFYVICKVLEPVSKSLTYTFKRDSKILAREGEHETYYIHKVDNATSYDSGYYKCSVNDDGVPSEDGESVHILVNELVDLNCDFERKDTCSWLQVDEPRSFNFTIEEERSESKKSHRFGTNSYLQMPQSMNKEIPSAVLRTPDLDKSNLESCLSFRYRMHGPGVYSLAVWRYSKLWQNFPARHNLWTVIGDQGDQWVKKKLTIESHNKIYLQFEAFGDVAIDDIRYLYRGSCSYHY